MDKGISSQAVKDDQKERTLGDPKSERTWYEQVGQKDFECVGLHGFGTKSLDGLLGMERAISARAGQCQDRP